MDYSKIDLFGGTGVRELNDESVKIEVAGTSLYIVGVPVRETLNFEQAFRDVPPEAFKIIAPSLSRRNGNSEAAKSRFILRRAYTWRAYRAPVLWGFGDIFAIREKVESGLFQEDGTSLYVNRGLGIEAHPRFRFFSRPEVTMIEIN